MPIVRPLAVAILLACVSTPALAQLSGFSVAKADQQQALGENYWRASGRVELVREDMSFFADEAEYFVKEHRLVAVGNVVYSSKENRIAADRLEFNTETRLGTFFNASGTARLTENVDRSMFGTQEPEAYFYGETIEKVGPNKYRIRKGGFTTCLQPTPRWEITAGTVTLTLEDYAVVTNSLLKVKGVPLFYMPIFYYPVQEDDRATGFLIPTYGTSTVRGQSLSNAFFWAISRSQDATFFHDWFSRTGQGVGGEYRFIAAPGSEGNFRTYFLNESATTYTDSAGVQRDQPARRSYELRGRVSQNLPLGLRARGDVDYFSDVTVQQTYQTNLYEATLRQRSYGGNVAGSWGANSVSGTYGIRELFFNEENSTVYGTAPRVFYNRAPRRLFGSPVYLSFTSEYLNNLRTFRSGDREDAQGVRRIDASPTIRFPLSRWPFLAVNSSVSWRNTFYGDSLDERGRRIEDGVYRTYVDMRAEVTGPTFTRIFDTENGFAEKIKHIIEPSVAIQRNTLIDNYDRIIKLDSYDYTYGGVTRITYGLTNRVLARKAAGPGQQPSAREFVTISATQTYYTDPLASQVDPTYGTSFLGRAPQKLSPWLVNARVAPTNDSDVNLRLEYDQYEGDLLSIGAAGRVGYRDVFQATAGWSRRQFDANRSDNYMNVGTTVRALQGRVGGFFGFDYDFFRDQMLQRRIQAYYNAQCCGVAVELQTFNFPTFDPRFIVPRDRRFNITFTLAGIGTFSNIFGLFGNADPARAR